MASLPYKNIIVNFPLDSHQFKQAITHANDNTTFYFIIENEQEYEEASQLMSEKSNVLYQVTPFYNGGNIDFFSKNVFLNKDDIFSEPIILRKIFCT